jgi:hypothetical protein
MLRHAVNARCAASIKRFSYVGKCKSFGHRSIQSYARSIAPRALASFENGASDENVADRVTGYLMALVATGGFMFHQDVVESCGIVGVIGKNGDASDFLLEGLTILQNRGYDSAGMSTQKHTTESTTPITTTKFASVAGTADSINLLRNSKSRHEGNSVGIAHTRWATHGKQLVFLDVSLLFLKPTIV